MIYLDNAATTYPKPNEVYDALDYAQRNLSFNAGRGSYKKSTDCLQVLDDLRKEISSFVKTDYQNVTILSSATEALNLIINGLDLKDGMNVYITPFEHNAIVRPLYNLKKTIDLNIHVLPFDKETWEPELQKIENMFALNNPDAVFCSQISNVTGLLLDYEELFSLSKKYNAINVLDAAQGFGIININTKNIDFIVYAGHKSMHGPFGIGGFINLTDYSLKIIKSGGTGSDTLNHDMPGSKHGRYESGSPNVPAAYGTIAGLKWLKKNNVLEYEKNLTKYLIDSLESLEKVNTFLPKNKNKVFGIVSIAIDGYSAEEIGRILSDEYDICIRTGYHCSPLIHEFINSTNNGGTARISISCYTKKEEIDQLIKAFETF